MEGRVPGDEGGEDDAEPQRELREPRVARVLPGEEQHCGSAALREADEAVHRVVC